jgi:hypothetical protein
LPGVISEQWLLQHNQEHEICRYSRVYTK